MRTMRAWLALATLLLIAGPTFAQNVATLPVTATQSGTWTVQPGNTANTTAWLVTGTGGTFPATQSGAWNITNISGTVSLPTGAATAANQSTEITALQLIDNLPNTLGSTTSGQSGVLTLGAVTTSAPTYTNAQSNAFSLQTDGSLRVAITNGGGGGTSQADNATFTDNTTSLTPIGGPAESASPTTCAEGHECSVATTLNRAMKVTLYDTSGNALTPSQDQTEDAPSAGGETGPMVLSVRRDVAATSAGTTGDFATFNTNALGALWVSEIDPCSSEAKSTTAISMTAATVIIPAASGKKNYVCSIVVQAGATAEIFNVQEGTGTTCGTGTAAIIGSTTAANGMPFDVKSGFSAISGNSTVLAGKTANVDMCAVPSSTNRISGFVTWVQR